jgi:restriction system protein
MARRKKSSRAEEFMELVAMLPWWLGVALALLSYALLHGIAAQPMPTATQPGQMRDMVAQGLLKGLAGVGQYILPILCLAGAGLSAWQRRARTNLVDDVTQSNARDVLEGMSWRDFEMLVGEGFRLQGYQVLETGMGGADGGVDLVLSKPGTNGGEKLLVQCKHWRAYKVGVDVVRELYGVMAARGATGGFVVTSGRFTDAAVSFASGRNLRLIDGPKLRGMLQQARATASPDAVPSSSQPFAQTNAAPAQSTTCPQCSKPMIRRTAKRGANAGGEFWGCTGYPACRGTRPIG